MENTLKYALTTLAATICLFGFMPNFWFDAAQFVAYSNFSDGASAFGIMLAGGVVVCLMTAMMARDRTLSETMAFGAVASAVSFVLVAMTSDYYDFANPPWLPEELVRIAWLCALTTQMIIVAGLLFAMSQVMRPRMARLTCVAVCILTITVFWYFYDPIAVKEVSWGVSLLLFWGMISTLFIINSLVRAKRGERSSP